MWVSSRQEGKEKKKVKYREICTFPGHVFPTEVITSPSVSLKKKKAYVWYEKRTPVFDYSSVEGNDRISVRK